MFPHEPGQGERALLFIAGFHLGIPLAICHTHRSTGWAGVYEELSATFSQYSGSFEVVPIHYEGVTHFPLGKPLVMRQRDFLDVFDLPGYLRDGGFPVPPEKCRLAHLTWICPSGVVLIMGRISFDTDDTIALVQFEENVIENHYAELSYLFTEIAEVLYSVIPRSILSSSVCYGSRIERIQEGIDLRRKSSGPGRQDSAARASVAVRILQGCDKARALYEDILIDVYYIDFCASGPQEQRLIGYVDSSMVSSDPANVLMIGIAYSSFVGFLWLVEHLGEQSRALQDSLIGISGVKKEISSELKLFRIFCLRLINESKPISVRLTREYMECIEQFWESSRLYSLVDQVNDQLGVLERMFDWVEESERQVRTMKIELAAALLALISIAAVAAQLVSTVDVTSQLGAEERMGLIALGFIVGILGTTVIYLLPISRWRAPLKAKERSSGRYE